MDSLHSFLQRWRQELVGLTRLPEPELVVPTEERFDEQGYLDANRDVAEAVLNGTVASGWRHYSVFGKHEGRQMRCYATTRTQTMPVFRTWYRLRLRIGQLVQGQRDLQTRLHDLEVDQHQLRDLLALVHRCSPPPPKHLQLRVVGNYTESFVRSGFTSVVPMLNRALQSVDRELTDFASVLDFGCGCGRAVFALSQVMPDADLHATDIDEEAVHWLGYSFPQLATYTVCPTHPPMPYENDSFDFVFGISVLTHLPEDMQFSWLAELARVVKPDGYVVLTTHGTTHVRDLQESERAAFERTGFLYVPSGYGASISLPDFYENSFHSHDYIRREWSRDFDVVDIQEPAAGEHQDLVLLRRRP